GRRIRPGGARRCARSGRTRAARARSAGATTAEAAARTTGAADVHGTDVTLAQHGIPGLLDLAAGVRGHAVVLAVVQQDVGVTHAGRRAVQVVDGQALPGSTAPVVVVEPGVDVGEVHRLRVDVLRALDGVLGGYARARVHQPGQRAGFAGLAVLVVHESRVFHVNAIVVI